MASVVVIGGNGFLGSAIVDELAAAGHEVTAFDRFTSGRPVYTAEGVRAIRGDVLEPIDVRRALEGQQYVFHFVSSSTPATAEASPTLDLRTNIPATVSLLAAAADMGVERVFYASSGGAIYGDQALDAFSEDVVPEPLSPYAIGKLAIEGYLRYFWRTRGLPSVSLRISNPYGPRQRTSRGQGVIASFLRSAARGEPVTVYGGGSMVRDYIYAEDVARMVCSTVGTLAQHRIYNIGSGTGTSVAEIVDLVGEVTGVPLKVEHAERPRTFVERSVLDVSRFTDEFGVGAGVGLREGMERTWAALAGEVR